MASKPRPSLLDLFDPLLAEAVKVPIPDSPPVTPQKALERGVENKENLAPNELTMSVFFNRISRKTCPPNVMATSPLCGPLVEFEDAEVESEDGRGQASPRVPLTELSVDDFLMPSNLASNYGTSHKKSTSSSHSSFCGTMPFTPSPLRQTQSTSSPFPVISVNDPDDLESLRMQTTPSVEDSSSPQKLEPWRESLQTSPSKGLLLPSNHDNSGHKRSRRRSSIDISTTLSSLSSSSFHMPDASFDLVNGEISFLTKSSEEPDTDHDVLIDSLDPQTPRTSLLPQTLSPEKSLLDLSRTKHPSQNILLTTTSTRPSIREAEIYPQSHLAHGQPTLSSGFTKPIRGEYLPIQALNVASTITMGGQDTPPSAKKDSSVPAPVKKLRVFTSKHTFAKRETIGMVATSASTCLSASKKSPQESTAECGASCNSGIPQGSTAKGAVVEDTRGQYKGKPATSKRPLTAKPMLTTMKVSSRTVRSIEASALQKEDTAEASRIRAITRLPAPVVRIGTVANQGPSGWLGSTQRGRRIPMPSTSLKRST